MEHDFGQLKMYQASLVHVRADRVLRSIINNLLREFNLTTMEWLMLGVVEQSPKSGITLSKIASELDVSQPQVTALMEKVMSQGLVRQRVHKNDRRSRTAVVTIKGKRLLDKIEENVSAFMKTWLSEIPSDQLQNYALLVQRVANYRPTQD